MSIVIDLGPSGEAIVRGDAPPRAAPVSRTPANDGHGDVRKKVVPVVKAPDSPTVSSWEGGALATIESWLAAPQEGGAIVLRPSDDPAALRDTSNRLSLIAVDFPKLNDGRGYSTASLLRQRYGYAGRLRAVGQITADQVFALARVGFDSFELRADQSADLAVAAIRSFTVAYPSTSAGLGAIAAPDEAEATARIRLLERELAAIAAEHQNVALASSLSAEDMVITDAIARLGLPIKIFTLDTGRLHEETLALVGATQAKYGIELEVYRPDTQDVAAYVAAHGKDGFYDGIAQRKLCCEIRKVAPLNRALAGRDAWITGQRRDQAASRGALREREHDAERSIAKYNPLAAWAWADVLDYVARFDAPMSALYGRGYVSIGCDPCTKAVRPGEDPRAGRWWWENEDSKECGLHTTLTTAR